MTYRLWKRWLKYTERRANAAASLCAVLYGTGIVVREWWGYRCVSPISVVIHRGGICEDQAYKET